MPKFARAAALALCVVTCSGQAAPVIAASSTPLRSMSVETTAVTKVATRRCWLSNGQKHCRLIDGPVASRTYGYQGQGSAYYERDASKLPFGSQRWWSVKEGEGSTGRP
jgi:hypothetical protein